LGVSRQANAEITNVFRLTLLMAAQLVDVSYKTQGVWSSPLLRKKSAAQRASSDTLCNFERDLLAYISAYGDQLEDWKQLISTYDLTSIKVGRCDNNCYAWNIVTNWSLGHAHCLSTWLPHRSKCGSLGLYPPWGCAL
jgi:hypothetical protein